jgi:hypothetical protein
MRGKGCSESRKAATRFDPAKEGIAMRVEKLMVTHHGALKAKYGSRFSAIRKALAALVASDKTRGLVTRVVSLDDATALRRAGGMAFDKATDERKAKAAIDALYTHYAPDYLVLVGAQDVVPHIGLENPMNTNRSRLDDDDDATVPSDLPYACDAAFSRLASHFLGPTRVIGRLPDLPGASDSRYLERLLAIAARHRSRTRADYESCFALSARVWVDSTELSVSNLFGPDAKVRTSPDAGPNFSNAQLAPRVHFINCHGDTLSPTFFGEGPPERYFDAHRSKRLRKRVTEGSVVAAECCYGAELYDPADAAGNPGICTTYLEEGAYGFFGSTTIAYGPSEGNGQADLVCQFFVDAVMKGASLGRAALEARQRFIAQYSHHDPSDLKTIAQFILLGDPSIHPVREQSHAFARSKALARGKQSGIVVPSARAFRRERIMRTGNNLAKTVGAAVPVSSRPPMAVQTFLLKAARESGIKRPRIESWTVKFPAESGARVSADIRASRRARSMHAVIGTTGSEIPGVGRSVLAIIATLEGRKIVHVRRVHSR